MTTLADIAARRADDASCFAPLNHGPTAAEKREAMIREAVLNIYCPRFLRLNTNNGNFLPVYFYRAILYEYRTLASRT